jgi:hypothetical protein
MIEGAAPKREVRQYSKDDRIATPGVVATVGAEV